MKLNAVVINAFPINKAKEDVLELMIRNFKEMGLTVVVVSGCDIAERISSIVDYYIVNREKLFLPKQQKYKYCKLMDIKAGQIASFWFTLGKGQAHSFSRCHNPTIARNTRLVFEFLKSLGIQNVLYTEDDNLFYLNCKDVILKTLNELNDGQYKMSTNTGTMGEGYEGSGCRNLLFSCFFFANVDFFLKHFSIPCSIEGWNDEFNIRQYKLYRTYEESLYESFKQVLDDIKPFNEQYKALLSNNGIKINCTSRFSNFEWRLDTLFNVMENSVDKKLYFVAFDFRHFEDPTPLRCTVEIDGKITHDQMMSSNCWSYFPVGENSQIKIGLNNQFYKIVDTSDRESILANGELFMPI